MFYKCVKAKPSTLKLTPGPLNLGVRVYCMSACVCETYKTPLSTKKFNGPMILKVVN